MIPELDFQVSKPPSDKESLDDRQTLQYPPSPNSLPSTASSASSSRVSLDQDDDENVTVTANRLSKQLQADRGHEDDLRLLAISTHMTELSYSISDIQTRIFEIQELRHKSQAGDADTAGTNSIIDQSLMNLNERLEAVSNGMKSVNESLEPFLQSAPTPTLPNSSHGQETAMILRKHATLMSEWSAVQEESEVLKEELKEDKWLTVFRTVTDQADGMMSSLEKAVNRCQDFIWQVKRRGPDDLSASTGSTRSDKSPLSLETFNSLLDSFEAKKKHYMPATSKVLSIIDKGVRDRVTKNGETLRRHAESAARWKNLRDRIARTDTDMQTAKRILLGADATPSEAGSSTSGVSAANGYLATPSNARSPSASSSVSRSMSPLKKFARRITTRVGTPPITPLNVAKAEKGRAPSSEPIGKAARQKHRSSFISPFSKPSQPTTPVTPDKPTHKHSMSATPESGPRSSSRLASSTIRAGTPSGKNPWNSSTRVEPTASPPRRPPSSAGRYSEGNPVISAPYKRSLSRTSMASSRPWSPVTSSVSTAPSSSHLASTSSNRPPSRARTPSRTIPPRATTPARAPSRTRTSAPPTPARAPSRIYGPSISAPVPAPTPKARPEHPGTPSHIPGPSKTTSPRSDDGLDDGLSTTSGRAFSPTASVSGANGSPGHYPPRPPSRSMIPLPTLSVSLPSRPGTAMSARTGADSPTSDFRGLSYRAQTPEYALKTRLQNLPIHQSTIRASSYGGRPSLNRNGPPSAFRADQSVSRPPSRSTSRMSSYGDGDQLPLHEYTPGNLKDPLDVEVAAIANSIPHGLLIERVDPALRKVPKEGEEIKAQYMFSNALSRKIVTCRLSTLVKSSRAANGESTTTINKKVMCRVGGGWQDLSHYILNRQAGM